MASIIRSIIIDDSVWHPDWKKAGAEHFDRARKALLQKAASFEKQETEVLLAGEDNLAHSIMAHGFLEIAASADRDTGELFVSIESEQQSLTRRVSSFNRLRLSEVEANIVTMLSLTAEAVNGRAAAMLALHDGETMVKGPWKPIFETVAMALRAPRL